MSTIFQKFQKRNFFPAMPAKDDLPISHTNPHDKIGIRRRLSSLSVKIQPLSSSTTSTWTFRRSKSMSSIGEFAGGSLRKWWDWGFGWILSRKPTFARDLEMNEEETAMLGFHTKGSWRHVLFKVKSELRRVIGSQSIPSTQGFRYDSFSYEQNFDDGRKKSAED